MTTTKTSLFAGAAVIVAGGLVFAFRTSPSTSANDGRGTIGYQETYKADISMAFRAGDTQMTPGSYEFKVNHNSGAPIILVQKTDGSVKAMVMAGPGSDAPKAWRNEGKPKISFDCVDSACSLARLWNGQDVSTFDFAAPKRTAAEKERASAVEVGLSRAD
jgi:hypothetical protein